MISPVPQIQCFKLDPQWEFVVVGSDGVWDAMSNQVRQMKVMHIKQNGFLKNEFLFYFKGTDQFYSISAFGLHDDGSEGQVRIVGPLRADSGYVLR